MSTYKEVIEAFFNFREAKSRYDRVFVGRMGSVFYIYRYSLVAAMDKQHLLLFCYQCAVRGLLKRLAEFARVLRERYGMDIEFKPVYLDYSPFDLLCRIGNTAYIVRGIAELDLEKKSLEYIDGFRVYLGNEKVEHIMDIHVRKDFVLTIGAVGNEPVARFTKYDMELLKRIVVRSDQPPNFFAYWLAKFWIPLTEYRFFIETIVQLMDINAHKELNASLNLLGYK